MDELDLLGSRIAHPWFGYRPTPVGLAGDRVVVHEDEGLVRTLPERPYTWKTMGPSGPGMDVVSARLHGEDLLVVWARDGVQHLEVHPRDGTRLPVVQDLGGPWTWLECSRTHDPTALVQAGSPTARRAWSRAADGTLTELAFAAWEDPEIVFEHHLVAASDGARVPVSLVRRRATPPGPDTPVWLHAYGGFGKSVQLGMSFGRRLFVEAGGIAAMVHARGGGEGGELWHEASRLAAHDRTFEDVLEVAGWFVD